MYTYIYVYIYILNVIQWSPNLWPTSYSGKNSFRCRYKASCSHVGPGPTTGVPSMGVFQRDPSSYLREFRMKSLKPPNSFVSKSDHRLNLASPSTILRTESPGRWWGEEKETNNNMSNKNPYLFYMLSLFREKILWSTFYIVFVSNTAIPM